MSIYMVGKMPENYEVCKGNDVIVRDGAELRNPLILNEGTCIVSSGGVVSGATVCHFATLVVSSGGTATDIEVTSNGRLQVASGGELIRCRISSGGMMYVRKGGKIEGTWVMDDDSIVWGEMDPQMRVIFNSASCSNEQKKECREK